MRLNSQIPQREEVVAAQEASDRAGQEERLERLLGLSQGHHAPLLPLRLPGEPCHGGGTKTPDHRRRRDHAAHPRAPEEGLHILPQHRVRGRVSIPGERDCRGAENIIQKNIILQRGKAIT